MTGIYFPGHWRPFGGAVEPGEDPKTALRRELQEELELESIQAKLLTIFSFYFPDYRRIWRHFYEVPVAFSMLNTLILNEGRAMRHLSASELLTLPREVSYDSFAIFKYEANLSHTGLGQY